MRQKLLKTKLPIVFLSIAICCSFMSMLMFDSLAVSNSSRSLYQSLSEFRQSNLFPRISEIEPWQYSNPQQPEKCLRKHFKRGSNFLTCYTPCRIASWVYNGGRRRLDFKEDCYQAGTPSAKLLNESSQASQLQAKDTIYVNFLKLDDFVENFLPNITVDVILLAGQQQITPAPLDPNLMKNILENKHILHWFIHNLDMFGGVYKSHPKMSPLPFGLKQGGFYNVNTAIEYGKAFLRHLMPNRSSLLYVSFLAKTNDSREKVPAGKKKVPMSEYLDGMAGSKFVLSPNGMKPECYRHYEAIGLGTVPVTELNPAFAWHLNGSVVYNNTNWDMHHLRKVLPSVNITVNRNMIFEEYWIEYMEREVNRGPLFWWDRHAFRRSTLGQFITKIDPGNNEGEGRNQERRESDGDDDSSSD